ncbi:FtsK/SpoIIIE domain-containing protein [Dactylosporangium sp. CA-092794]|uniref:FtsK/SpoIIIE domain-containing protein n=1 Tax=Dactylosporangium sp. CA-092794 TaxID=3239929 RepID=UPI003D94F11A
MNLTFTTIDADGTRRDSMVRLADTSTVGDLRHAIGDRTLFLGAEALDPAAPVAGSGIREGVVLGLDRPAPVAEPVWAGGPTGGEPVLAELHQVGGPGAGRCWRLGTGSYEIGADAECAIRLPGPGTVERGLWLTIGLDGAATWHLDPDTVGEGDEPVTPAVVVAPPDADAPHLSRPPDGEPLAGLDGAGAAPAGGEPVPWPPGGDLAAGTALLRLTPPTEPDAAVSRSADGIGIDYNRPPRIAPHLESARIRLPGRPPAASRAPFPFLLMVAPVGLGLVMVGLFNSYFYLVFILFTPVMAASNWLMSRRGNRRNQREAWRSYRSRVTALRREIRASVEQERAVRCFTGPDPATVGLVATGPGGRLWERRRTDADHLLMRVGTADLPSVKEIEDSGRDEHQRTVRWNVPDVPVAMELQEYGVVGIAGTPATVRGLARWWAVQAAVLHSPRDLRIVVLTTDTDRTSWDWIRWLQHARPGGADGPLVAIGNDPESVANRVNELVADIEARERALGSSMGRAMFADPDVLVIADGARRLRDVPGMVRVLSGGPRVRVFAFCLDEQERLLPEECAAVVVAAGTEVTVRRSGLPDLTAIRADLVDAGWCEQVARALAPIRDVSPEHDSGLPRQVRLLELVEAEPPEAERIAARWRAVPATTTFTIGTGYEGPLRLDLVRDGPHGLVAGTTGAGKSELLQTLVAALALTNRPDELTFVLVDYKGGSAFHECADLPHTLGMVTDLDGYLVQRALDSLAAELRRRERLLAAAGAKDLPALQAMRRADPSLPRLPRLVLVIDEFATLVRELPDFVPGLIGIAQRGRSLGIHLILATQRPAGAVSTDIRANTNLRIALRVTDPSESQDVIDTNEAAHIPASTPGRALVRLALKTAIPFQTAWVGAPRDDAEDSEDAAAPPEPEAEPVPLQAIEIGWQGLGRPVRPAAEEAVRQTRGLAPTDLGALVAAVRDATARLEDFAPQPSPWLPALAERVLVDDLPAIERGERDIPPIPYGLEDIPALQERRVATVDLSVFGHLYVIGAPRSGRTQVLRTIAGSAARTVPASDVHIYGIDAAGGGLAALEALPHCAAVVSRHDLERLERLVHRLIGELNQRQEACAARGCAGLVELRRMLPAGERPPHILLLVDGWDAIAPVFDEHDNGRLLTEMVRLLREGAAAGIHVVATSERTLLSGRFATYNDHKLLLRQGDRSDYQLVGLTPAKVPVSVPPGRGWHLVSRTETQIAQLVAGEDGRRQADELRRIGTVAAARDAGIPAARRPAPVAPLPSSVSFQEAYERVPAALVRPLWGLLGVGGDDGAPVGADLAATGCSFLVAGPAGSGRSNALACLAVSLLAGGTSLVVLTPRESPLRALAQHASVRLIADAEPTAEAVDEALAALSGPKVVVVDDADLLAATAADRALRAVALSGRDHNLGLLYAGGADTIGSAMSAWLTAAKRSRRGLLLAPRGFQEGELIGVRLPGSVVRATHPLGRAWTGGPGGRPVTLQVPLAALRD